MDNSVPGGSCLMQELKSMVLMDISSVRLIPNVFFAGH